MVIIYNLITKKFIIVYFNLLTYYLKIIIILLFCFNNNKFNLSLNKIVKNENFHKKHFNSFNNICKSNNYVD